MKLLSAAILLLTACAIPVLAASNAPSKPTTEAKPVAPSPLPTGVIKGTISMMRGLSYGYMTPKVGQEFVLDLGSVAQNPIQIKFAGGYIPLPGRVPTVNVAWTGAKKTDWSSLRAVFVGEQGHKVTVDVSRLGESSIGMTQVWILIESRNRIIGMAELEGTLASTTK